MGRESKPQYYIPLSSGLRGTETIASAWFSRWLVPRLSNSGALMQVRSHSKDFFYTHGARVQLPYIEDDQGGLFAERDAEWFDDSDCSDV